MRLLLLRLKFDAMEHSAFTVLKLKSELCDNHFSLLSFSPSQAFPYISDSFVIIFKPIISI